VVAAFLAAMLAVTTFVPALAVGDTVPALPLVDQAGQAFSLEDLRGNAVVLTFIYTRCPDPTMCPLISSKFARLQSMLGDLPVHLVEITLDPQFDSPRVLRTYGAAYMQNPRRWTLATGAPSSIDDLATRLSVATQWTTPETLVHTESLTLLDREGRIVQTIDGNAWTPAQVLAAAREAAGATPSPVARVGLWLTAVVQSCGGGRGTLNTAEGLALLALVAGAIGFVLFRALRSAR
jgi:cytochrome oxidase Cu insertion factor (SCO1/SenC/PrrC family)